MMRLLRGWLAPLAFMTAVIGSAAAQPVDTGHSVADLISERAAVAPGDQFLAAVKLDLAPGGWHVYWRNPGDSGLPPMVSWTLPDGMEHGDFVWPTPHAIPLTTLMNYGYETQLVLPIEMTVPADAKPGDTLAMQGALDILICLDTCIPESGVINLSLPVEATQRINEESSALIASYLAQAPTPLSGSATVERLADGFRVGIASEEIATAAAGKLKEIHFFPNGHEILHAEPQTFRRGPAGVTAELKSSDFAAKGEQALGGVLLVEQTDGTRQSWTVDATPGAMAAGISDTALRAGAASGSGASLGGIALLSVMGFAFIGGLVLNLMPCVLPVLTIKAAGLVHTAHNPKESRAHGLAYLAGVLVCFAAFGAILVALRALGEQAGLGFQLQYAPVTAAFALLMFAVGLNLLGVFEIGGSLMGVGGGLAQKSGTSGAFFTGLLAAFVGAPCVGPFLAAPVGVALEQPAPIVIAVFLMVGAGLAAPFVALSFTPALARLLPKPGKWMVTFRQALAFPMFLTALWLLWVLAGQGGSDAVILVLAGATLLVFGIWLARIAGRSLAGRAVATLAILAALIGPTVAASGMHAPEANAGVVVATNEGEPWSPERVAQLQAEGRPIFIDFTARWCVTCQMNKRIAIHTARVQEAFERYDVAFLVADWTNRDSVIAEELARHGRAGVPLYLMYPASGGPPVELPQILSPGLLAKAVEEAAGGKSASGPQTGDRT